MGRTRAISPLAALEEAAAALGAQGRGFALIGGLAVSVRGEVRFTRDVDLAVVVQDDADAETLIFQLRDAGMRVVATVEHQTQHRLATARLESKSGIVVDLMFASTGIEAEIVGRATPLQVGALDALAVARAEELLAMKVLSERPDRPQDAMDIRGLLAFVPELDLAAVRDNLALIESRGYAREQDLKAKLDTLLDTLTA
jgi:Nucleotidyl transferase AbiEii toxin, Type IV TA system